MFGGCLPCCATSQNLVEDVEESVEVPKIDGTSFEVRPASSTHSGGSRASADRLESCLESFNDFEKVESEAMSLVASELSQQSFLVDVKEVLNKKPLCSTSHCQISTATWCGRTVAMKELCLDQKWHMQDVYRRCELRSSFQKESPNQWAKNDCFFFGDEITFRDYFVNSQDQLIEERNAHTAELTPFKLSWAEYNELYILKNSTFLIVGHSVKRVRCYRRSLWVGLKMIVWTSWGMWILKMLSASCIQPEICCKRFTSWARSSIPVWWSCWEQTWTPNPFFWLSSWNTRMLRRSEKCCKFLSQGMDGHGACSHCLLSNCGGQCK